MNALQRNEKRFEARRAKTLANPLPAEEWCFDAGRVEKWELEACLYWEYGRESQKVRDLARYCPEYDPFYGDRFPEPWQSLTERLRRKLSVLAGHLRVIPFRVISAKVPWSGMQSRASRVVMPDGEERIVGRDGVEVLLVEINWADYTDKQIREAFKKWLETSKRPQMPACEEPKAKRGHDLHDIRASLERLGIMRLAHVHSFDDMGDIVGEYLPAESAGRAKYSDKSETAKERNKALKDFHRLFRFDEVPASWEPVSGW